MCLDSNRYNETVLSWFICNKSFFSDRLIKEYKKKITQRTLQNRWNTGIDWRGIKKRKCNSTIMHRLNVKARYGRGIDWRVRIIEYKWISTRQIQYFVEKYAIDVLFLCFSNRYTIVSAPYSWILFLWCDLPLRSTCTSNSMFSFQRETIY